MQKNPILNKPNYIALYFLFWAGIIIVYSLLFTIGSAISFETAFTDGIIFNLILSLLGLGIWYPVKYISFEDNSITSILLNHTISGMLTILIWLASGYYLINTVIQISGYKIFFFESLPWRFFTGILFYAFITTFYYVTIYYTMNKKRLEKESDLKNMVTEARLNTLKFQINPHFIFNSLNSISALIDLDSRKAREMMLKLADFYRFTLAKRESPMNKFSEELTNINRYLDIEKIRFEDKFDYREEVEPECMGIKVPNMILQPLLENAIKHAVYESLERVNIILSAKTEGGILVINLENNFDPSAIKKSGTGVGLKNIANRLELIYNQKNLLEINKDENIFRAVLHIPVSN